jgi:hypothetical protein
VAEILTDLQAVRRQFWAAKRFDAGCHAAYTDALMEAGWDVEAEAIRILDGKERSKVRHRAGLVQLDPDTWNALGGVGSWWAVAEVFADPFVFAYFRYIVAHADGRRRAALAYQFRRIEKSGAAAQIERRVDVAGLRVMVEDELPRAYRFQISHVPYYVVHKYWLRMLWPVFWNPRQRQLDVILDVADVEQRRREAEED